MDSESTQELGFIALPILSAIPLVAYAIWADYFSRRISRLDEERQADRTGPNYSKAEELFSVRSAGVSAVFAQFVIFMATRDIRLSHPIASLAIFLGSIATQAYLQAKLEKQLRKTAANPSESLKLLARAAGWFMLCAVAYFGTVIGAMQAAFILGKSLGFSQIAMIASVLASGAAAILGGMGLNFALGAFHLRRTLPVTRITDPDTVESLSQCFNKAGLPIPDFWQIELDRFQVAAAMIAGFKDGKGFFKPGLFISKTVLSNLSPAELDAVVFHEVSHLALSHLRKRFTYACGLMMAAGSLGCFILMGLFLVLRNPGVVVAVGPLIGIIAFIATFSMLSQQSKYQELEADGHAVLKMGATIEAFSSALRKLDSLNDQIAEDRQRVYSLARTGHPATEQRIKYLKAYLEYQRRKEEAAASSAETKEAA